MFSAVAAFYFHKIKAPSLVYPQTVSLPQITPLVPHPQFTLSKVSNPPTHRQTYPAVY